MHAQRWVANGPEGISTLELVDVDVPEPGPGEVTIEVRAGGLNPIDYKIINRVGPDDYPLPIGFEVAGVIAAIGPGTEIASGGGAVGDAVLAYRIVGGFATA